MCRVTLFYGVGGSFRLITAILREFYEEMYVRGPSYIYLLLATAVPLNGIVNFLLVNSKCRKFTIG